jgi:hypothetical protein
MRTIISYLTYQKRNLRNNHLNAKASSSVPISHRDVSRSGVLKWILFINPTLDTSAHAIAARGSLEQALTYQLEISATSSDYCKGYAVE